MLTPKKHLAWFLFILLNLSPVVCLAATKQAPAKDATWVNQVFQKGKSHYEAGKYDAAVKEWKSLDPYLDQYPSIQKIIEYLKSQIRDAKEYVPAIEVTTVTVTPAPAPISAPDVAPVTTTVVVKESKVALPEALPATIAQAGNDLRNALEKTENEKTAQETWIESTFQKGKAFYEQGETELALAEWEKMAYKLDSYPDVKAGIVAVKESHERLKQARETSGDFASGQYAGLKSARREEIVEALTKAEKELRLKADEMMEQKRGMQKSLEDRRDWINLNFEKGRQLYKEGKYREAFEQWKVVAPYLENEAEMRILLDSSAESLAAYENSVDASRAVLKTEKPSAPEGMRRSLDEMLKEMAQQTKKLEAQRSQAESALDKRDDQITETFERGRLLYSQGKLPEAVLEWKKLISMMEDGPELNAMIARFEEHHKTSNTISQRVKELAVDKARYSPPADLKALIASADKDLRVQIDSATQERLAMELGLKERDEWIQTTLQKAKADFDTGHMADAIDEWNKLVSYLDANSEERGMLERLKKNYFDAEEARKQNKQTLDRQGVKLQLPEGFKKAIDDAYRKTIEDLNQARIEREAMQRDVVDRQAWVVTTYQRGKSLYDAGRVEEALAEWKKLPDHLDEKTNVRSPLLQMESALRDAHEAERALKASQEQKAAKSKAPEGLSEKLQKASAELKAVAEEATQKRTALDKEFIERQQWVNATAKAADLYYQQGKMKEALEEWQKLAPYIAESSPASHDLRQAKQAQDLALQAKKDAVEAMATGYRGIQVPQEIGALLRDVTRKLETETLEQNRAKSLAQQNLSDKQRAAALTFEKARLFHQNGEKARAMEQWNALLPYLEPSSAEARQIELLKTQYQDWERASKALQGSQSALSAPVPAPTDLAGLIGESMGQLRTQIQQADMQRSKSEQTDAARRKTMETAYQKGRTLYVKNDITGALEQWASMAPVLDEVSAKQVSEAWRLHKDSLEARKAAEMADSRKAAKLMAPADLLKTLDQATQKAKADIQSFMTQRELAEQALAQRQAALRTTFEKGKLYHQAGDLPDALKTWNSMLPELADASARNAIQDLEKAQNALVAAQKAAQDMELKKSQPVPAPEGFVAFLSEAEQALAKKNQDAMLEKGRMEKTVAERQAAVNTSFQNARVLLAKGQWREAVSELEKMSPYLDEKSGLVGSIQNLKKSSAQADAAEQASAQFAANEYKTLKIPFTDELTKLLSQAGEKIQTDILRSQKKKAEMEKTLAEREAWARATFDKGKAFYDAGKYKEAVEFWSSLTPYLQNEAAMKALMNSLSQSHQAAQEAEKDAADAQARQQAGIAAPPELTKVAEELAAKLKTMNFEAVSRKEKAEQLTSAREAEMIKALHVGAEQAQAGRFDETLKTWSSLSSYMQEPAKVQAMLDGLTLSYQDMKSAEKAATTAEEISKRPLTPPVELASLLADVSKKMDKETQVADLGRQRAEKIAIDREEKIKGFFTEGKLQYDQGRLSAAFLSWRNLLPFVSDEKELGDKISQAEQSYQKFVQTRDRGQEALAKKEMKLTSPPELMTVLDQANRSMGDQIFEMKNKTMQTEKTVSERRSWVDVTFQKGKLAYNQGRYKEAAAEWRTLLPFIENGEQLKYALDDFERNLQVSMESSKVLSDAGSKKDARFAAPDELATLLTQLNEKVKNEALEATAEKVKAEQVYFDRKKAMQQAFQEGKTAFEEGRVEEALAAWGRLAPYLEAQSGMQSLLGAVKQSYRESLEAKKSAVEAAAQDYQGLKLPYADSMEKMLVDAEKKLKEEAGKLQTKKREVEKTMAERQEWSVTTFNKGKVYFDAGQYEQALDQWERLLPYLPDSSDIKRQLQMLREHFNVTARDKAGLGPEPEAGAERPVMLKDEGEMLAVLAQAGDKLKKESQEIRAKADVAEKQMQERRDWIEYTFQQGKKSYDQGNYNKAVEQWGLIGPYLGEHPKVREEIDALKKDHDATRTANRVIEAVEAKKAGLLPLPAIAAKRPAPTEKDPVEEESKEEDSSSSDPAPSGAVEASSGNGQLVSGEIVSVDGPQKTVTVKLYTSTGKEETLTVNFDDKTQVDGSLGDLASAQSGANVELRYNPETSRALYVYVY